MNEIERRLESIENILRQLLTDKDEELITIEEAARMANLCTKKVYQMAKDDRFPKATFGRAIRVRKNEFMRYCGG